jgi:tetratricopeptide (TPR) repeat protein
LLEPDNASYYRARARQALFTLSDPQPAIKDLRKSLTLDSYDSEAWMDLADAYSASGDKDNALNAVRQAINADFSTPSIHWRASVYLLAYDDFGQAKSQMKLAVQGNHYLSYDATRAAWSVNNDANDVFEVLPKTQYSYAEALHFFIEKDQPTAAVRAWDQLLKSGALIEPHEKAPEPKSAFEWRHSKALIDFLLNKSEFEKAEKVWTDACQSSPNEHYCEAGNFIANGSFEEPLHPRGDLAGFDWRILKDGVTRNADDSVDAQNSLEIDFTNSPPNEPAIMQWLRLPPNSSLVARVAYKPNMYATTSALQLIVEDRNGVVWGKELLPAERRGWIELSMPFNTPSDTRGAKIKLLSGGITNGSLLLDNFRITMSR